MENHFTLILYDLVSHKHNIIFFRAQTEDNIAKIRNRKEKATQGN